MSGILRKASQYFSLCVGVIERVYLTCDKTPEGWEQYSMGLLVTPSAWERQLSLPLLTTQIHEDFRDLFPSRQFSLVMLNFLDEQCGPGTLQRFVDASELLYSASQPQFSM